jgi:hypothetical protein
MLTKLHALIMDAMDPSIICNGNLGRNLSRCNTFHHIRVRETRKGHLDTIHDKKDGVTFLLVAGDEDLEVPNCLAMRIDTENN